MSAVVRPSLLAALAWGALACAPKPEVVILHPTGSDGAREVLQVNFTQTLTQPDNFVLRPDEFGGVVVDHRRNLVYVGSRDAYMLALDTQTGGVVWERKLGDSISSVPVLADVPGEADEAPAQMLIVGTDNGVVHAIDPQTHETAWRYETPGRITGAPVVADGTVFITNSRDQIYALDVRTGTWRWQYEQAFSNEFTVYGHAGLSYLPAAADELAGETGTLFTGFDNGRVVALGASSGQALWLANVAPPEGGDFVDCDSTPWIDALRGVLVVSGQTTGVHALSLDDGSMLWRYPVEGVSSVVGAGDGSLIAASSLQGLFALDSEGALRWRAELEPGVVRGPVIVDDVAFLTHAELGLLAFDVVNGELLAQLRTGSGVSTPPTFDPVGQRLYVTSNRGELLSLRVGAGLLRASSLNVVAAE